MPLENAQAPNAAIKLVRQVLQVSAFGGQFQLPKLAAAVPQSLFVSFPHRCVHLPLSAIRRSFQKLSACTVPMGWRFLVQQRKTGTLGSVAIETFDAIASITAIEVSSGRFALGEMNEGPFVQGSEIAARRAEKLNAVREQQYEAVLLAAPAVHVVALWLSSKNGGNDILLPIPPLAVGLVPYEPIDEADFLKILSGLAKSVG